MAVFQAAYLVLSVLFSVLSGGALMGAFVPVFVRLGGGERKPAALSFITAAGMVVAAGLALVSVLLFLFAPEVARLIASGFLPREQAQMVTLLRLMLPMLFFHGVASLFGAALVSNGRLASAGLAPALQPVVGLVVLFLFSSSWGVPALASGLVVGVVLQAVVLLPVLSSAGIFPAAPAGAPAGSVREFMREYLFAALAHTAFSALLLANQAIAGSLSARDLAVFAFGNKLVMLVLAFLTTVAANVALPHFSRIAWQGGPSAAWQTVVALTRRFFLPLVVAACLWALGSTGIVTILYARNSFTAADVALVASVQRWFVFQLPFYVIGVICWRMHNALGHNRVLVVASLAALAVAPLVAWPTSRLWGVQAIAAAHSLAIVIWTVVLVAALYLPYLRSLRIDHDSKPTG